MIYTIIKHSKREALHNVIQNSIHNKREELPSDIHHDKTQKKEALHKDIQNIIHN